MTHLGTIEGTGRLIVGSAEVCEARYHIIVHQGGAFGFNTASGTLEADLDALRKAWSSGSDCVLRLETGDEIALNIDALTDSGAAISVNGPVPGF